MIIQFLASTTEFRCFTPPYREYSTWDNIELFLMLISFAVIWGLGAYFLMYGLKLIIDRLKNILTEKK